MKSITTILLILCISLCNAQLIDTVTFNKSKISIGIAGVYKEELNNLTLDSIKNINDSTQYRYYSNQEREERFWTEKKQLTRISDLSRPVVPFIDSIVAHPDGSIAYYYSNALWKERYYALKKLRSYGYFRIPLRNRKKFAKAEKYYKQLMK